jgi:C-terminal peptidase prc
VDPEFNGVDWNEVREQTTASIEEGVKPEAFNALLEDVVASLDDDHSYYLTAEEAAGADALNRGEEGYVGVGIVVLPRPEKGDGLISWVLADNAADDAGIKARDRLLAVDGEPICCDERGELFDLIAGEDGTELVMTVQSPAAEPRDVTVIRRPIQITEVVDARMLTERIGYIVVYTFLFEETGARFEEAWRMLNAEESLQGLILDFRPNSGGFHSERDAVLELFTYGELGLYQSRSASYPLNLAGRDVLGSQSIPLVVLIGTNTNSNGEIFAGTLQEAKRATLIGGVTRANVESLYPHDLPDLSRLWLAEETFIPPSGSDWETTGIIPDIEISQQWDEFIDEASDEALSAAIDWLEASIPPESETTP